MTFTADEIAGYYGTSRTTLWRHLKKHSDKFKRTSTGKLYNEQDAQQISFILGFTIPELKQFETQKSGNFSTSFK